jgi:hypothetical protein
MNKVNATEIWPLYDSVMICNAVTTLYPKANWYAQYSDFADPAEIPFFNVRNRSIGMQYNNFDSSEKLPFVYHIYGLAISVQAPIVSQIKIGEDNPTAANQTRPGDLFFATELARHSAFILKVGQDEKMVNATNLLPPGSGVHGFADMFNKAGNNAGSMPSNLQNGVPEHKNVWAFPEPIAVPRDRNVSGTLVLSSYMRESLKKCIGPGNYLNDDTADHPNKYPAASVIRATLIGKREVQLRNNLFNG